MSKPAPIAIAMDEDEALELLRGSAALEIDLVDALVEREPQPEELAADEPSRCKYLSKKCLRRRATKAKGELHKLCTFHRAKAILNQRRLERRKRGRGPADQPHGDVAVDVQPEVHVVVKRRRRSTSAIRTPAASEDRDAQERAKARVSRKRGRAAAAAASSLVMLPAIDVDGDEPVLMDHASAKRLCVGGGRGTPSPRDVQELEPFRTPATLFPEDLEAVRGLVDADALEWPVAYWDFCV